MYYDTQRKLAFVMPPRTGTTMFETLLKQWGVPSVGQNKHLKPSEVQLDGIEQYTIYGFFRDPVDRFLSMLRHMQQKYGSLEKLTTDMNLSADQIKALNYDGLVDLFPKYQNTFPFYFHGQTEWLANAQLLDYRNYVPEILRVARMLDVTQVYVGVMNQTDNTGVAPSQRVIDFVQSQYADDYRLGKERGLLA